MPVVTQESGPSGGQFTVRAVVLLVVVLMLLASYATSLHAWWNQRQEIIMLQERKAATEQQIAELEDIEKRWNDPAYVRQQARERFGWVMPGEVGYRVIGLDGELQGTGARLDVPQAPPAQTWAERLWGSMERAGQPPAPATDSTDEPADPVLKSKKD